MSAPHDDEAPTTGDAARGFREQTTTDTGSIAQSGLDHLAGDQATIRAEVEQRDKQIANLKARAAIAGYVLQVVTAGNGGSAFMIQKFGLVRELHDVAAVERFLQQAGAR